MKQTLILALIALSSLSYASNDLNAHMKLTNAASDNAFNIVLKDDAAKAIFEAMDWVQSERKNHMSNDGLHTAVIKKTSGDTTCRLDSLALRGSNGNLEVVNTTYECQISVAQDN